MLKLAFISIFTFTTIIIFCRIESAIVDFGVIGIIIFERILGQFALFLVMSFQHEVGDAFEKEFQRAEITETGGVDGDVGAEKFMNTRVAFSVASVVLDIV